VGPARAPWAGAPPATDHACRPAVPTPTSPDDNKLLSGFNDWLSAKPDEHVKQGLASFGK